MKKLFIFIFFCLFFAFKGNAQERYVYTQYHLNPVLVNPGATGLDNLHGFIFNYRNKWAGFEGSPRTLTFSYDGPLTERVGLGALVLRDRFASLETLKGQLSYAYKIKSENYSVGAGITTEYLQYELSGDALTNPFTDAADPQLLERLEGAKYLGVAFGIYAMLNDNVSFGLSLPGLVRTRLDDGSDIDNDEGLHFILHGSYKYKVPNYNFSIEPSIYINQLRNVPFHIDANLLMHFLDEDLTGGLSYTIGADNRFGFLIGTKLNDFNFYYSYNFSFQEFQQYNNGSHELTVAFNLSQFRGSEE